MENQLYSLLIQVVRYGDIKHLRLEVVQAMLEHFLKKITLKISLMKN
jgi:hypothetical protein